VACADDDDIRLTTSSHSNSVQDREDPEHSPYEGSQFDDKTDCENDSLDSTSTVSAEPEAYQRPMCLDTPFSEVDSDDDYIVYNCAVCVTKAPVQEYPSCSSLRKKEDRLSQSSKDTACLSTWVTINGVRALTLFDSGSMTDSVSPDFTQVMDLRLFQLMKQVALQLGCVGSRGSINYGVHPKISFASIQEHPYYLDIVNINRYDCILGTPFMCEHNITLDFGISAIIVHGQKVLALSSKEEASLLASRR
jgi:Retroviral aspartyl protease